ncbi:glycosyl transferase [Pyronema omphalodes]|nr:glycosyl transferase [Pyronema omphalodes]
MSDTLLPILKKISGTKAATAEEIDNALDLISQNRISPVQAGALLTALHYTGLKPSNKYPGDLSNAITSALEEQCTPELADALITAQSLSTGTPASASSTSAYSLRELIARIASSHGKESTPKIAEDLGSSLSEAFQQISLGTCSAAQTGILLTSLHYTGLDMQASIIATAARQLRSVGHKIQNLKQHPSSGPGPYSGGLVDIVGTGGDGHDTFNVSTTAAIVVSGCGVRVCKHGSKASTSASGSADILMSLGAKLLSVTPDVVSTMYAEDNHPESSFCFLYAPVFHPAMAQIGPIRRELGCRTIFNVLGPLINPVDYSITEGLEARILGVGKKELGPVYAETLKLLGARKVMVVCGEEQLDEISPAGYTDAWWIGDEKDGERKIHTFKMHPKETFGLDTHPLSVVAGGKKPEENAVILKALLAGKMPRGEPITDFVLLNAAALLVVSDAVHDRAEGEVDWEIGSDGIIRGAIWTKAVERALEGINSGESWRCWERFVKTSQQAEEAQQS